MIPGREALDRLRTGNARFASNVRGPDTIVSHTRRPELPSEQEPLAIILGCSDARVPAELIFDQGLGDLFVIRVAGNIVAPSLVGSVEFAASQFGTRLVVVLGHSKCGAVTATLDELQRPTENQSRNLQSIVKTHPSLRGGVAHHRPGARPRCDHRAGGAPEHPGVGRSPSAWIGGARATDSGRRAACGRGGVFTGDGRGGFLRWSPRRGLR